MLFDEITNDGRLWSVRYEGEEENALFRSFAQWNDVEWLRAFFYENKDDLESYFKVTDVMRLSMTRSKTATNYSALFLI